MSDIGYPEGIVERELREHGVYASNTVGYSMSPLLRHHKDVVIIEPPTGILKKYDVALYPDGKGNYILHRVIAVRDGEYIIRGDNTFVKEHVPHSAVVGVLVAYNRGGKGMIARSSDIGCIPDSGALYIRFAACGEK